MRVTFWDKIINVYNNNFLIFCCMVIGVLIMRIFFIYQNENNAEERWKDYILIIKKKTIETCVLVFLFLVLVFFSAAVFSINVWQLLNFSLYWKVVLGILIVVEIILGEKLYDRLCFLAYLEKVEKGRYPYHSREDILLAMMDRYHAYYLLETERLGIFKNLSPISLIPLIAGYIFEGKNMEVNWNWYTIIFFGLLFIYFYMLWKCYKNMQLWKYRELDTQKSLRNVQKENSKKNENIFGR